MPYNNSIFAVSDHLPVISTFIQKDSNNCYKFKWNNDYNGNHNAINFIQGNGSKFICYNNKFYACGWESNQPYFATNMLNDQQIGDWTCNLPNATWQPQKTDCYKNYFTNQDFNGYHNVNGFKDGSGQDTFICYNNRFYECGWEPNRPDFAIKKSNNDIIGSWKCDLPNKKWQPLEENCHEYIWNQDYNGNHNTIRYTNRTGGDHMLCYNNRFYACGWTGTTDLAIPKNNEDQIGNWTCNNNAWQNNNQTTPTQQTCTSFTYTSWSPSTCPQSEIQTQTISTRLPTGCVGGNPDSLTRTCTYNQPPQVNPICTSYPEQRFTNAQWLTHRSNWRSGSYSLIEIIRRAKIWKYCD